MSTAETINARSGRVDMYTDGACKGNPGPGGWGVLLQYGEHRRELWGGEANTTNNRMELLAVIEGLAAITRPCEIHVHTDSQYVQKGISEWIQGWKRRGWRTAAGQPAAKRSSGASAGALPYRPPPGTTYRLPSVHAAPAAAASLRIPQL